MLTEGYHAHSLRWEAEAVQSSDKDVDVGAGKGKPAALALRKKGDVELVAMVVSR